MFPQPVGMPLNLDDDGMVQQAVQQGGGHDVVAEDGACRLANQAGLVRLKHVRHILENNRDQLPDSPDTTTELPQDHENIRGRHHFH